jgi:hypothetical protein
MKAKLFIGAILLLVVLLVGCTAPQVDTDDSGFTCPDDNQYFACRGPDDPRPTCGANQDAYNDFLAQNCPGVEILE